VGSRAIEDAYEQKNRNGFEAARSEFRKFEQPVNEAEFRLMQSVEAKA
jgi:hypothetical protein